MNERDQNKLLNVGFKFLRIRKTSDGRRVSFILEIKSIDEDWTVIHASTKRTDCIAESEKVLKDCKIICLKSSIWNY